MFFALTCAIAERRAIISRAALLVNVTAMTPVSYTHLIDAARALQNSGTGNRNKQIAQFYCELAEDELVNTHPEKALPLLDTALSIDRMSVRATILTGDALMALGKPEDCLLYT